MNRKIIFLLIICFLVLKPFQGFAAGRLPGIDSWSRFLVYYGNDFSPENLQLMTLYDVVVLNPNAVGVTPSVVAYLQNNGVKFVFGYISIGEDDSEIVIGNGEGPVYHDGSEVVQTNDGIASFYVDQEWDGTQYLSDGIADVNSFFGGRFVYPNDDWRWVINTQRIGGSSGLPHRSKAGLQQIVGVRISDDDNNSANDFGFDGFFLDTIDTAGPFEDAWGYYPWVAEEMKNTVKFIHETYPDKIVMANRGVFFYNPSLANTIFNVKPYDFTLRPYIHAVVFESYALDSNPSQPGTSPYFNDNRYNYAPKLIAEANRNDGFTIFCIDYQVGRGAAYYDLAIEESTVLNGWVEYLAQDLSLDTIGTYVIDNAPQADTSPPQWDSTGSGGFSMEDVPDRVGIQAVKAGSIPGEVVIQWDTAKDQTLPIKYHIYQSTDPTFATAVKYEDVSFQIGEGWAQDPSSAYANEYAVSGLSPGTYYFRVRAEDSTPQGFEDDNEVTLSITLYPPEQPVSNPGSVIDLDGNLSDWVDMMTFEEDPDDVIGTNNIANWRNLWLSHNGSTLYVAYQNYGPIELNWAYNLYLDADSSRATGFRGGGDEFPIGAEYLLQGRFLFRYLGSGTDFSWSYLGAADFAVDSGTVEFSLPRDWLGDPSALDLFLLGDNAAFGSESLDQYPDGALSSGGWGPFFRYEFTQISNPVQGLSVDGDLSDWGASKAFGSDAKDVNGSQNLLDWRGLRMAHDIDSLYLAYENEGTISLNWAYSAYLDVDGSRSTGFQGSGDDLPVGAEFLFQGPYLFRYDGSGHSWSWTFVGTATFAANGSVAEFSFPRSWLDTTQRIHIFLFGDNSAYPGGNALDQYPDGGLRSGGGGHFFTYSTQ